MKASSCLRHLLGGAVLMLSVAALAENAVTTDTASVRAGPDSSYPEVAQLDADAPIQVMGCLNDWSWCDVTFEGNRGWLYSPDITYEYQGGYVPLYGYAPALGVPVVAFSVDTYWGSYYRDRPWYGQRDQWVHRTINHQRPPGPAPSNRLPPREVVRADRPRAGSQPAQPLRLGSAAPAPRDVETHDGAVGHDSRAPETHPQERSPPQPQHSAPPQRAEGNARPPERADASSREEHRPAAPKSEAPPPKEERDEHPR
jgi:uncharacterized protein YraI